MKPAIDYTLYLVTDSGLMSSATLEDAVEKAILGGCTLVQLREKSLAFDAFCNLGRRVKAVTDRYNVPLIINDDIDVALAVDAAGVHIGQGDKSCAFVRKIIGENKIIGVSASNLQEAFTAQRDGADYLGIGAMFPTGTKTDARVVSRDELVRITNQVSLPVVVIGGINENTLDFFGGIDIDGIAVVSAVIAQKDITEAAKKMKRLFAENRRPTVRNIDAAIFDLDGTILDSMDVWERIDVEFLKKRGHNEVPEFYLNEICARSFTEAAEYTIEYFGLSDTVKGLMNEWNCMALYEYAHSIRLKKGAAEYLRELKRCGVRLAVATSLPRHLYEPALKNNGVYDLFEIICSVDEVARGKEYPDIFEYAIRRLKLEPYKCLFFEDLFAAVRSAKSTGARVCGVYDKYSEKTAAEIKKAADFYINDFSKAPVIKPNK